MNKYESLTTKDDMPGVLIVVTGMLRRRLRTQSRTTKDTKDTKEEQSITAKDTKDAKEKD